MGFKTQPMLVVCDLGFYFFRFLKHIMKQGKEYEQARGSPKAGFSMWLRCWQTGIDSFCHDWHPGFSQCRQFSASGAEMERDSSLLCVLEGSLDVRESGKGYLCLFYLLLLPPLFCMATSLLWKHGEEFWYLSFYKAKRFSPSLLSAVALESTCMLKCCVLFCVLQSYGQHLALFIFLHFISTSSINIVRKICLFG